MVESIMNRSSQIEALSNEINGIQQNLKKLVEELQDIILAAEQIGYIDPKLVSDGIAVIQSHGILQEEFFKRMEAFFPELTVKNLALAEKVLADARLQADSFNLAYDAFKQFQYVDIKQDVENRENNLPILNKYKDEAKRLMEETAPENITDVSEPYRIFVENVKEYRLSDSEAEVIESVFPGQIYRMLYREQLILAPQEETTGDEQTMNNENPEEAFTDISGLDDNVDLDDITGKDDDIQDEVPRYIFRTEKEDKAFGVKAFLNEVKGHNGLNKMRILYMLGWCRVLSKNQLCYAIDSGDIEELLDAAIDSLIKEGYLTEITDTESDGKFYCISDKGAQMFEKKDSSEEFRKRKLKGPKVSSGPKVFKENQSLIPQMTYFNGLTLMITEKELTDISKEMDTEINTLLVNRSNSNCETLYYELTVDNGKGDKLKTIIVSGITKSEAGKSQISDVAAKTAYDFILYIPYDENDEDVWELLDSEPFNNFTCYIVKLDSSGEKEKLVFWDNEGNDCLIYGLLGNILPHVEEEDVLDDFLSEDELEVPLIFEDEEDGGFGDSPVKEEPHGSGLAESMETDDNADAACAVEDISVDAADVLCAAVDTPVDTIVVPYVEEDILAEHNTENIDKPIQEEVSAEEKMENDHGSASSAEMAAELLSVCQGKTAPDNFMPLIYQLIEEKSSMEAVVFAKTLSLIPDVPQYKTLYNRLLMAHNMSLDSHKYTGNSLGALDQEETVSPLISPDALKIFRLSSFAWALFMPDMPRDYMLYGYKDNIMGDVSEQLSEISPSSKQVFSLLFDLSSYSPVGFTSSVLSMFRTESNRQEVQEKLSVQAEDLLELPRKRMSTHLKRLPVMLQNCFGKKSDFYRCMEIVRSNNIDDRSFVQSTFDIFTDSFDSEDEMALHYSDRKIDDYIDLCWEDVQDGKATKLIPYSPARNSVVSNIKKRLDLMKDWLQLTDNVTGTVSKNFGMLAKIRNLLIEQLRTACMELYNSGDSDIQVQAGLYTIRDTFSKLLNYLRDGAPYQNKWDYINLLSSYQINLDDELKPNLNPNLQGVQGFEPWRRMLQHIASPKVSFEHILELIDNPDEPNWYSNYATAEHISLYLHETKGMELIEGLAESRNAAWQEAVQHGTDFKSKLELKYAYGNIEESTKETVLQTVSIFDDYFEEVGDFAHYRAFINVLEKRIDEESLQREKSLLQRKQKSIEEKNLTPENAPILGMIENTMEDGNFAVAEEYLNRLEYGELEIPEDELQVENESDYHGDFIKMYEEFYSICLRYKGDTPVNWGYRSIEGRLTSKAWQAGQKRSSEELIRHWPKRKDSPENAIAIRNFLGYLDFKVKSVVRDPNERIGDKYNLFNVNMTPTEKNLRDYSHPIARFGTLISNPIHVVCLFGANSANELINTITNKLQLGGNTIVLMDGALSHEERKKVAEKFKSDTSAQNFFLLIDRVLLLYLATLDRGERLPAMLKCTLPYTYYQPFVHGGGSINDEMFFGRKSELNSILNPNGACFVYGGRQLGKTALLQRACSIAHTPEEKRFAMYINIFEKGKDTFIRELCDELGSDRLKLIKNEHTSLESLCKELSDGFDKGNIVQLQLFIDEADVFLKEIENDKFSALTPLVNLKSRTNNRFKFVLAGLHNVARSKSAMDRNSIFQQLGMPLCIKPLSPSDARKLVERPLSYLGFKVEKTQLSLILAHTNYYPGIIHFFCYTLVESVAENYRSYYSAAGDNPPYYLNDEQLRRVFVSGDLNNQIKDKLDLTLKLDPRYKIIANIFAYLYYEDKKQEANRSNGYTAEQVRGVIDIPVLKALSDDDLELLLTEMMNMGILWSRPNSHTFRLRKNSFPEMICSEDKVEDALLAASEVM